MLSDALEWYQGGFSAVQLWLTMGHGNWFRIPRDGLTRRATPRTNRLKQGDPFALIAMVSRRRRTQSTDEGTPTAADRDAER